MKRASITEAKNGLSALLDRVRHGETVLIEDRGRAVAQITPVPRTEPGLDGDRLAELERRGIVRPARSPKAAASVLSKPPRARRAHALSQSVIEERARGW